ncbi:hypothetical protein [Ornithinibacillus xuwenensis]|uniref:Uncharacterized protein n=1 Tax=Ornithinibacillus xuwenensis TaxID=3144668 RepID=A0ABU9XJ32_9BACI
MELSIILSVVGIVLSFLGLFITVNKTTVINKHSDNQAISNSFNSTKIVNKGKTINGYNEYNHYTTINQNTEFRNSSQNNDDELGIIIMYGALSIIGFGILISSFIQYKSLIMLYLSIIVVVGVLASLLVLYRKRNLPNAYKYYTLLLWLIIFVYILLIKVPIYPPSNLEVVENKFIDIDILDSPGVLWGLVTNGYQEETYFLISQIAGIVIMISLIIFSYSLLYKMITKKPLKPINILVKNSLILIFLGGVFISGVLAKFLYFLQSL